MKLVEMETKLYEQKKTWPHSTPDITAISPETSKIKDETKRKIQCYTQETNSSSSCMSRLIYCETPLGLSMVADQCSIDEHHEENQLDEELMDASDYNTTDNPNKPSQPFSSTHSDKKTCSTHETSLLKLKQKAITCSDFKCSSHRTIPNFQFGEAADLEAPSSEEDYDVFTELPMSEEVLVNLHKMYISEKKQGQITNTDVFPVMADNNHEKKWNEHKTPLQMLSQKLNRERAGPDVSKQTHPLAS
ncbi:uncharacterized protein LOC132569120 [Heteronotia binoei]|uniref:uncharacterized protein LOC132569120 n=1 Tax=Heteronotia binoei TaxID=13085 RepID=UPI0029319C24|nr:uncharacterized protein LOC132569120 [Heteronotia binoei]